MTIGSKYEMSGLGFSLKGTMLLDLDSTAEFLRDMQTLRLGVEEHVPSVLPKPYRVPAVRALETRESDLLPEFTSVKEPLESFVEPIRKSLNRCLRNVFAAASLEHRVQIASVKELAGFIVVGFDHLKHLVVKMAALRQSRKEPLTLEAGWIKAIFASLEHGHYHTALETLYTARDSMDNGKGIHVAGTLISILFYFQGKREAAIFVGLWAPTILNLGQSLVDGE